VDSARVWFNTTAAAAFGPPKSEQLVVFDIDETLLCNIKVPDRLCLPPLPLRSVPLIWSCCVACVEYS
jgi:hypothetical protein